MSRLDGPSLTSWRLTFLVFDVPPAERGTLSPSLNASACLSRELRVECSCQAQLTVEHLEASRDFYYISVYICCCVVEAVFWACVLMF